ncbi:MAG: Bug family tripartite tricarboxylate transporter substrate binding protein [Actinomycetota bacterium]
MRYRSRSVPAVVTAFVIAGLTSLVAGCGRGDTDTAEKATYPTQALEIMAPADPGSGWDQTARTLQTVVEQTRLSDSGISVKNVPGSAGTIGLAEFAKEKDKHSLMVMGVVMLGGVVVNKPDATLESVTPIARLTSEYEVLVVPAESPYRSLKDLLAAFKKDPSKIAIVGGSAGGVDQVLAAELAKKVGVPLSKMNYTPYAGGGETIPVLLSGEAEVGLNGIAQYAEQIQAGELRPLAVSAPERVSTLKEVPTFIEQGVDVSIENWRGIVAPQSITSEDRKAITAFIEQVHATEGWRKALVTNGWNDRYLTGPGFDEFISAEQNRVTGVLTELGLAKK